MEIIKPKFTLLQQSIARFLAINVGKSYNALEISKYLKVSPTAIIKSIDKLKREELITIEKNKRFLIEYNKNNSVAVSFKRIENLKLVYESGLHDFLFDAFPEATIILFGSYSYGTDTIDSDIDLAVIGSKDKEIDLKKFESLLQRKIRIQFYPHLKEVQKNLKENILNGIVLKGGIEL
jgi:predicted nucleotidyltransferase